MWMREHLLTTQVDASAVWRRWTDVTLWPQDDPSVVAAGLYQPMGPGATGWIRPAKGRRTRFVVRVYDPQGGRFEIDTRFPGATMHVEHELSVGDADDAVTLLHRVRFTGPMAATWGNVVGRGIAAGLAQVMASIVAHAQATARQQA